MSTSITSWGVTAGISLHGSVSARAEIEKSAVIRQEGEEWILYTADGKRVLGRHKTAKEAYAQEYAIQKSQERQKSAAIPQSEILRYAEGYDENRYADRLHNLRLRRGECPRCGTPDQDPYPPCKCQEKSAAEDPFAKYPEHVQQCLADAFGLGPKAKPYVPHYQECPKCHEKKARVKEVHADTGMDDFELKCDACGAWSDMPQEKSASAADVGRDVGVGLAGAAAGTPAALMGMWIGGQLMGGNGGLAQAGKLPEWMTRNRRHWSIGNAAGTLPVAALASGPAVMLAGKLFGDGAKPQETMAGATVGAAGGYGLHELVHRLRFTGDELRSGARNPQLGGVAGRRVPLPGTMRAGDRSMFAALLGAALMPALFRHRSREKSASVNIPPGMAERFHRNLKAALGQDDKPTSWSVCGGVRMATFDELRHIANGGSTDLDKHAAAAALRKARNETHTHPTPAQAHEGNYRKGEFQFQGMPIKIENPKGSTRTGYKDGKVVWSRVMHADYGYFKGTKAVDGDAIDCFIGPNLDSELVVAIDQYRGDAFDETKFVLGTDSQEEGEKLYLRHYPKGWSLGPVSTCSIQQLKDWLRSGGHKKPFKKQKVKSAYHLLRQASSGR